MTDTTATTFTPEQAAQVAHAAVRSLQELLGEPVAPTWDQLDAEAREARATTAFQVGTLGLTADYAHAVWLHDRQRQGWTLGPKDHDARTSPDLLEWDALSDVAQRKARMFAAITHALLN